MLTYWREARSHHLCSLAKPPEALEELVGGGVTDPEGTPQQKYSHPGHSGVPVGSGKGNHRLIEVPSWKSESLGASTHWVKMLLRLRT